MIVDEDERKAYWNENYMKYWQERVAEAGEGVSSIIEGDARTEDDSVYEIIFRLTPFNKGNILEVGCAWGRMFPIYQRYRLKVSAVDISAAMIMAAYDRWAAEPWVIQISEASAERLPFEDGRFDNLVCLATFDATYQEAALSEFLRVTRPGAYLYLTGKNAKYYPDDYLALKAEVGARRKGHPNFFTDTTNLIHQMEKQGHNLKKAYYFPRRGDFGKMKYLLEDSGPYYEFFLIFERGINWEHLTQFSSPYSNTYRDTMSTDS
ncbi:MAG: class I SAM-dependent methyltransferase [Chromatiaceae bacterium]|nr:class I SAM-dependent methyltransferase [Chromatiaceae bacterium]